MTQKTFYHLHFITSSMFYGMCFTLRYYNLSELSQALKQTLQVGSELVILLAPRLSCMANMAARNNLNGPPPSGNKSPLLLHQKVKAGVENGNIFPDWHR